jgi:hypothetical protein
MRGKNLEFSCVCVFFAHTRKEEQNLQKEKVTFDERKATKKGEEH